MTTVLPLRSSGHSLRLDELEDRAVPALVAAYGFEEGAGTTTASNGGTGLTGTLTGATWVAAGKYGRALSFNGTSNLVTVADAAPLRLTTGMTLEAWVYPTASATDWSTALLKERGTTSLAYGLYAADGSGQPPAGYVNRSGNDYNATGTSALPLNTWTHLAATYNNSALRLYVNGTQVTSRSVSGSMSSSTAPLRIGGNTVWGEYFAGLIDEVRIYNNALTQAQIRADMTTPVVTGPDTTPPTVSVSAPAANAHLRGSATVSATATDNVAVAGVQFYLDGAPFGAEDTIAPYSVNWDSTTAPDGDHTLTAVARDAAGNEATASTVTVTVDNAAPTVAVTAPAVGANVTGTVPVTADATDNLAVAGVQFKLNGVTLGAEDTTAPYEATWDTTTVANGTYTITAVAVDAAGNVTTSDFVTVNVANADTTPPSVALTAPAPGATITGTVAVSATAADNVGVTGVGFYLDGVAIGPEVTTAPYAITWDTTAYPDGPHTISAVARDAAGNATTSAEVSVAIDHTPPTVAVTAPSANATVGGMADVTADAADNVGVAGVQFYLNGSPVGAEDTTTPYSLAWNTTGVAIGTYQLTARARDTAGNVKTSEVVSVTVANTDTTPPTATVTGPMAGSTVTGSVTVTANATDNVGVVGVQFLFDGNPLGAEDTIAPYTALWNSPSVANGSHTLAARARDAAGNITTSAGVTVTASNVNPVLLTVNGAQTFQTIDGFGVNVNAHSWDDGEVIPALDMLADQMGSTLFRVVYDMVDWEATNDNSDPFTPDWAYYNGIYSSPDFQELWSTIRYLNQKGFATEITLSLMGRVAPWMGGSVINVAAEDEWVETVATMAHYGRTTANVQFSILDPTNEPDHDGIEGPQVGAAQYTRLLNKLSARLDGMGLGDLRLGGPNTASISAGVNTYMPALMADPVVMAKIDHFALHDYSGSTGGAATAIQQSAYPTRNFWMTELTDPVDILSSIGQNASGIMIWDGFDSAYIHPTLHGASMVPPNDAGPDPAPITYDVPTHTYAPRKSFYEDTQIFKFVPPGSVRIGAAESNGNLTLYAFRHPATGRVTLVGRNAGGTNLTVTGALNNLPPAAAYEFYKTDAGSNFARLADVPASNGTVAFTAPANSYFTLTALTIPDSTPPTVSVTAPENNATATGTATVTADAADNVGVAGVQFYLNGAALGTEDTTSPYSAAWNTAGVPNGTYQLTARARDAAGNATTSGVVTVIVDNVVDTTPPTASLTSPAAEATVTGSVLVGADATDNIGVAGLQFYLDGVALGAEDTTAPYSVSWATATAANGSHTLTARARDAAGNATTSAAVTVTVNNTTTTGLVAAYGFEEGTGTTAGDGTANGLNGTIGGATWVTAGKYGKALSFNGSGNFVTIADANALDLTTGMTLEAWVYPTATATDWATALLKEQSGGLVYALYTADGANRPPAGYVKVGTDRSVTGTSVLPLNTWTHLATTYDNSTLRLYVNGTQVASRSQSGPITTSTGALRIGGNGVWGEYFTGRIDEVRVYNTALSQAQIQDDMANPVGGGGGAQLADRPPESPTEASQPAALSLAQVTPLLAVAVDHWIAAGVPAELLPRASTIAVHITDLPGSGLGFTDSHTGQIWLDRDAAGHGWDRAAGGFDLETVVTHEVGHLLGIDDLQPAADRPADLMDQALAPREQRYPSPLDVLLATTARPDVVPVSFLPVAMTPGEVISLAGVEVRISGMFASHGMAVPDSQWARFDRDSDRWEARPGYPGLAAPVRRASIDDNDGTPISTRAAGSGDEYRTMPDPDSGSDLLP